MENQGCLKCEKFVHAVDFPPCECTCHREVKVEDTPDWRAKWPEYFPGTVLAEDLSNFIESVHQEGYERGVKDEHAEIMKAVKKIFG